VLFWLVEMPAEGGSFGDPGSLDPSKAPERLYDLFNREGAFSRRAMF
jgi:hypothetical protein